MRSKAIALTFGLAVLLGTVVSGHHHFKQDFYVYDCTTKAFVLGAVVTVSYTGGTQSGETTRPHGSVWFIVPGELASLDVEVNADGYETALKTVLTGGRPNVGGRGFWIGLMPLENAAAVR